MMGHNNKENYSNGQHNKGAAMSHMHPHGGGGIDAEILIEKEQTIQQLKETIEILELKVKKLEQLVKLKDAKILNLSNKLQSAGITQ